MIHNDEEQLVSNEAVEHAPPPLVLDAAETEPSSSTAPHTTINDNASTSNSSESNNNDRGLSTRWFILEPAVLLLFFGRYLMTAVNQNQILYQTCLAICHHNETQCRPLLGIDRETKEESEIEAEAQHHVAKILMTMSLLESIIPAFVSLFLGPWSDKFGRRPILLTTFTGYLMSGAILTTIMLIATRHSINPWWFVLGSVPSVLSGGTCALITGIYCYISDVAKERKRAVRMVLNEASLCAGMMVGNVASSYIYAATNALIVFSIGTGTMFLALLYVFVFVSESLKPDEIHPGSAFREFFRFDLVRDLVRTCFKRRPNFDRAIIWLTMIALTIAIFTMEGESTVNYLFLRKQFDWTLKDYTLFNAARIIIQLVGSILGMILLRRIFKVSIVGMSMLAIGSSVLESTVRATAVYWWELYLGTTLGMMRGVLGPMCRAILSHVTPAHEVGKVYALTTSLESVSPLIASPLYATVYNATLVAYPSAFNFISAGFFFICYILITAIFGIQKSMDSSVVYQSIGS